MLRRPGALLRQDGVSLDKIKGKAKIKATAKNQGRMSFQQGAPSSMLVHLLGAPPDMLVHLPTCWCASVHHQAVQLPLCLGTADVHISSTTGRI